MKTQVKSSPFVETRKRIKNSFTMFMCTHLLTVFTLTCVSGIYENLNGITMQEYVNKNYTILTSNYTDGSVLSGLAFDYIFGNACRHDLNSELASFHSNQDYDLYFELVGDWSGNPYGLNFMTCQIGLWNESLLQPLWKWMDGTPYNWGHYGTNSSQWFEDYWTQNEGCVSVRNALNNPSNRIWEQYVCNTAFQVHCGVCNTPQQRPYLLELSGTWDDATGTTGSVLLWIQLNGTDLFGNGVDSIEFFEIKINENIWNYNRTLNNYSNIGPIKTITFLVRNVQTNITINQLRINYFQYRSGSSAIHLETHNSSNCQYKTITIQYWYQNYTIDDGTEYDDACIYGHDSLPTVEPTFYPSFYPLFIPSSIPSSFPSYTPSGHPVKSPTDLPTSTPTDVPSKIPTRIPTPMPTGPSQMSSTIPTIVPSDPAHSTAPSNLHTSVSAVLFPTQAPSQTSSDSNSDDVVLDRSLTIIIVVTIGIILLLCCVVWIGIIIHVERQKKEIATITQTEMTSKKASSKTISTIAQADMTGQERWQAVEPGSLHHSQRNVNYNVGLHKKSAASGSDSSEDDDIDHEYEVPNTRNVTSFGPSTNHHANGNTYNYNYGNNSDEIDINMDGSEPESESKSHHSDTDELYAVPKNNDNDDDVNQATHNGETRVDTPKGNRKSKRKRTKTGNGATKSERKFKMNDQETMAAINMNSDIKIDDEDVDVEDLYGIENQVQNKLGLLTKQASTQW